ncbi:hypothetical protein [uncultured Ferrimonas sp.]|uniref:hypothetical protein n=1 Tax=uncultured Ferrimonas sp. TaxID=432640 RepID=UPI00260EF2D2|nr:hypothetical protein [uncultured Ferrimonas sp.]
MKLSKVKSIYNNLPPTIAKPLQYLPFELFLGSVYRKQLEKLHLFHAQKSEIVERAHRQLLFDYCNWAIDSVPFYRDFSRSSRIGHVSSFEDFYKLPIIDKEQICEDLRWFSPKDRVKSFSVTTGGTTGKQTKILMSNEAFRKEWAFVAHFLYTNGIDINESRLCFRGVSTVANRVVNYNPLYKELQVSPFKICQSNIDEIMSNVLRFNATWIHGYPSAISDFAKLILKNGIDLKFKLVLLVSESCSDDQRYVISKAFGAKVVTFYGMTERVIFAGGEVGAKLSCNKLYGCTEIVGGELVGTGFVNKATALIRYRSGDQALTHCDDIGNVSEISKVIGRWGKEYLIGKSGTHITMTALNVHDDIFDSVRRYQFRQKRVGECLIDIEFYSKDYDVSIVPKVVSLFQSKLGGEIILTPNVVDEISLTGRGKHKFIINELID